MPSPEALKNFLKSNLWQSPIIVALKKEKYSTSDLSLHPQV